MRIFPAHIRFASYPFSDYGIAFYINSVFMLPGLGEVITGLHAYPTFCLSTKRFSRQMAISGENPAWPLMTRDKVWRATPRTFAPSVTERFSGSRRASLIDRPGWGGFSSAFLKLLSGVTCF